MSLFARKFLSEEGRRVGNGNSRQALLAAFGKHPGWDDHIDDLGLVTETLVLAKKHLYLEGIGGQIDSGAWEKLEPDLRGGDFNHHLVWTRSGEFLAGKIWASRDGKGRARYPMIVLMHCFGLSASWIVQRGMPLLEEVQRGCAQCATADEVRKTLATYGEIARQAAEADPVPPLSQFAAGILSDPGLAQTEALARILHQAKLQVGVYSPERLKQLELAPHHLRVPRGTASAGEAFIFWNLFLRSQLTEEVPRLFLVPAEEGHLDIVLGEPTTHEFYCLKASAKALPAAHTIPFKVSDETRSELEQWLTQVRSGQVSSETEFTRKNGSGLFGGLFSRFRTAGSKSPPSP